MRRVYLTVAILTLCSAAPVVAQTGRALGIVRDTGGRPIKGATVKASNPDAVAEFTSSTDDKGRFAMIGLRSGQWKFVAEAPGYFKQEGTAAIRAAGGPPIEFTLARDPGPIPGALEKDIQQELDAAAALRSQGRFDQAISAYQAIQAKNVKLTSVNLVLAGLYREKAQQEKEKAPRQALLDRAAAAYSEVLKEEPANERATIELALTRAAGGDLEAADRALTTLAQLPNASSDVFYSIGEIKFSKGELDEAEKMYQRAVQIDSTWLRPKLKLGLLAYRRGDQTTAIQAFEAVIAAAPNGPDAAEAANYLKELKK